MPGGARETSIGHGASETVDMGKGPHNHSINS